MRVPCRPSEIHIPNDPAFGDGVARYAEEMARLTGFPDSDLQSIGLGVGEAFKALLGYSFDPGEKAELALLFEHLPEGLRITIKDRGLPFGAAEVSSGGAVCLLGDASGLCSRVFGLKNHFDEVRLKGLGPEGKETVLVRRLKRRTLEEHYRACEMDDYPIVVPPPFSGEPKWTVRRMVPSEAPDVARLVYRAYGYTYGHDQVYYPDRFAALTQSGKIEPVVALSGDGEMAGHAVLQALEDSPRIAELAQAVVAPEYRSRGALSAMTDYLLRLAKGKGLYGVFTQAVTEHVFSQKTAHRFGLRDCALLLGIIPRGAEFRGIKTLEQRGSLLLQFRHLNVPGGTVCHAPARHRKMISEIYEGLGWLPEIVTDPPVVPREARSSLRVVALAYLQFAQIEILRCGVDVLEQVKTNLKELCLHGFEIIHLHLDLNEPWTAHLAGAFEELGFFFAGLLPGAFSDGDALILQFLNKLAIPYDAIRVESEIAREMLAYIRARDPNA